ncbi:hypothetical protein BDN72DRAFT_749513, partial [Pluteus cervinus]
KLLGLTLDSASVNDVLVRNVDKDIEVFWTILYHVRCFLHVINLVSKSLLSPFD